MRASFTSAGSLALGALLAVGCGHPARAPDGGSAIDAGRDAAAVDAAGDLDAGPAVRDTGPAFTRPTRIVAMFVFTPVHVAPRRDSPNVGYLRAGSVVDVVEGPVGRETCPVHRGHPEGGWYRIRDGGFVCVGGSMAMPYPQRGFVAERPADLDASLPYPYAINYGQTMMYRRLPTASDLREFEPWRFQRPGGDASAEGGAPSAAPEAGAPTPAPARTAARDAGRPTLDDLRGERGGPVIRRLLSGMYVALDRVVRDRDLGERYWHTQSGGYVREGRLSPMRSWPTFRGFALDEQHTLPVAFMVSEQGWDYLVSPTGRGVSAHRRMARLTGVFLSNDPPIVRGTQTWYRTTDGRAVHARSVRRALLEAPPAGVGPTDRWVDVDLDEQVLTAYEGPRPVYVTLVSSGRRDDRHPERNFETPAGSFRVQAKHVTNTMDGDTAADGPYSIEDVPWVQYFEGSYALHAAFWHGYYGWRMSHGCVNLSPFDGRWLFFWTLPSLPVGWHGVYAGPGRPGTLVRLRHSRANAREVGRPVGAARATTVRP